MNDRLRASVEISLPIAEVSDLSPAFTAGVWPTASKSAICSVLCQRVQDDNDMHGLCCVTYLHLSAKIGN